MYSLCNPGHLQETPYPQVAEKQGGQAARPALQGGKRTGRGEGDRHWQKGKRIDRRENGVAEVRVTDTARGCGALLVQLLAAQAKQLRKRLFPPKRDEPPRLTPEAGTTGVPTSSPSQI